jgi:hypothetical protein
MGRGIAWLTVVVAGVWVLSLAPALSVAGTAGMWHSLLAGVVCLAPALCTWGMICRSMRHSINWQMAAILGGSIVRMFAVLAAGGVILASAENVRKNWVLFVSTLIVYYLAILATETRLAMALRQRRGMARGEQ